MCGGGWVSLMHQWVYTDLRRSTVFVPKLSQSGGEGGRYILNRHLISSGSVKRRDSMDGDPPRPVPHLGIYTRIANILWNGPIFTAIVSKLKAHG